MIGRVPKKNKCEMSDDIVHIIPETSNYISMMLF